MKDNIYGEISSLSTSTTLSAARGKASRWTFDELAPAGLTLVEQVMRRMRKTFAVPSLCRSVYTQLLDTIITRNSKLLLLPFISSKCPESPSNMDEVTVYIYDIASSGICHKWFSMWKAVDIELLLNVSMAWLKMWTVEILWIRMWTLNQDNIEFSPLLWVSWSRFQAPRSAVCTATWRSSRSRPPRMVIVIITELGWLSSLAQSLNGHHYPTADGYRHYPRAQMV